jgi:membrane fusion protein (multidrug efflux system)
VLTDNSIYPIAGKLYTVNPTLDQKTGTIAVEARYSNPDGLLRPGQFARVRVRVGTATNALVIPQTAVTQTQGVSTAYTVGSDNVAALHTISLGQQIGQNVIVLSGLNKNDRVIVEGAAKVQPGNKVVLQGVAAR